MPLAMIIVDVQHDFCEGGALAVPDANEIFPVINRIRNMLNPSRVIFTQDWHPPTHTSFIDNNPGETLFKPRADGQMMWPTHCVQGTPGAELHPYVYPEYVDIIIKKGKRPTVDSYSGFGSEPLLRQEPCAEGSPEALGVEPAADTRKERTELEDILNACGITDVIVVGLALDYCVAATAKDAAAAGFQVTVIKEGTRAVSPETGEKAVTEMKAAGVRVLETFEDMLWEMGI